MNSLQHKPFLCALFCLFLLIRPNIANSATIYVDDSAPGGCGGFCGTDWSNAYNNLQDAIAASVAGDIIVVAGGTYTPDASDRDASFVIKSGTQLWGGYDGNSVGGLPGTRSSTSVLSGEIGAAGVSDNSYTVVYIEDAAANTIIDGFTITGGYADNVTSSLDHRHGGGIFITATSTNTCSPQINDCIITSNLAANNGGGIFNSGGGFGGTADVRIENTTISNNSGSLGGGIFNDGNLCTATATLISCDFASNSASSTGGGLYNFAKAGGSASASAINTIFRANSAGSAGGFYSLASSNATSVSNITNCTFSANDANVGGAVYVNEEPGSTTQTNIINSILWNSDPDNDTFHPLFHYSGDGTPEIIIAYSIVDAANCQDIKFGTDVQCGAGMLYNQDPMFTAGFDLSSSSPAINSGDNSAVAVSLDIHQEQRIQNGMVDLGVDETPFGLLLPVELAAFEVKAYDEKSALLNWVTASELDNDFFTIEHSTDGIRYTKVDEILGAGTTNETQYYSYIHRQPTLGINYYRVKQTDFDGQYSYSPIRTITFENTTKEASVYPNPVAEVLYVDLGSNLSDEAVHYAIYDWSGKEVLRSKFASNYGQASINFSNQDQLQTGIYVLKIEGLQEALKFVKR